MKRSISRKENILIGTIFVLIAFSFFIFGRTQGTILCGVISSIGALYFIALRKTKIDSENSPKSNLKKTNEFYDFKQKLEKKDRINNYSTDHIIKICDDYIEFTRKEQEIKLTTIQIDNLKRVWLYVEYHLVNSGLSAGYNIRTCIYIEIKDPEKRYEVYGKFSLESEVFILFQKLNKKFKGKVEVTTEEDVFYYFIKKWLVVKKEKLREVIIWIAVLVFLFISPIIIKILTP